MSGLHVLSTIRARDGSASVDWLVEDRFAPLLAGHPQIDHLHVFERRRLRRPWHWWRLPALAAAMRRRRYDAALDLQGNAKSGFLTFLSGARRKVGLGPPLQREGNGLFVRETIAPPRGDVPRLDAYYALVDAVCGAGPIAPARLGPRPPPTHGAIVLHPGVSGFGAFKRWPAERFAELGDRLAAELGAPVRLTCGPGERAQAEDVRARMTTDAAIADTPSLGDLVRELAGARLVVACDTGPAHIAGATGVPTLVLFGPKDPRVHAPAGPRVATVRTGVRCSPCTLRWCPAPVCMTEMGVDLVAAEARALLAANA